MVARTTREKYHSYNGIVHDSYLFSDSRRYCVMNTKRKAVEDHIYKTISAIDHTGTNTQRYKDLFAKLSDSAFDQMMLDVRDGKCKLIILYVPNLKINLKLANLFKVAHDLGVEMFERIKFFDETTRRWYFTPHKYMIAKLPVRRLKQALELKRSLPEGDSKTDAFTGQVVKPDKGSSISSPEAQIILSKGLTTCIHELINIRGGNLPAYAEFKSQLQETGSVSLNEIPTDSQVRSSVVLATYMRSMLLDTNLSK